jgi:23S rRNA (uracil1939-C5)-methyltransferase
VNPDVEEIRPGDAFEARCTGLDDLGAAVAEIVSGQGSLRVHISGALPGEHVRARLEHVSVHARSSGREAWAVVEAVLAPSGDRVEPPCPAHGSCGGCVLMNLAAPAQLAWKREQVALQLAAHPALAEVMVDACVASPRPTAYRNQAKYVYGRVRDSGEPVLGAFARRSHAVVDLAGCHVVEPVLDETRAVLLAVLRAAAVEPFDEIRRTGALRYAVLRATSENAVIVTLVSARSDWAQAESVAAALAKAWPAVKSVVLNVNRTSGNVLFGDEERLLAGRPFVEDRVGDVRVRLVSRSFFQANRQQASRIYRDLVAALPARVARAVDVYSGAGPIAFHLAAIAGEVIAIEEVSAATRTAAEFLVEQALAGGRVRMVTGDAVHGLSQVDAADVVVVNPPRRGCAPEVRDALLRLRPRVLAYLSCDPRTLARDLAVLVAAGARVVKVTPYDMLPHTPHVETMALVGFG